jgi:hypothetical protein
METLIIPSLGEFGTGTVLPHLVITDLSGTLNITSITSVPEPASVVLLSLGVAVVGWRLRKRRSVAF